MKSAAVAIVGFALLLGAIAAFAPASLIDRRLAAVSSAKLRMADAAGTVWNGTGILTDATGSWRVHVGWSVSALALARGSVQRDAASRRRRDTARHDRHRHQRGHIARRRGRASRNRVGERVPGSRRDRAGRNRYVHRTGIHMERRTRQRRAERPVARRSPRCGGNERRSRYRRRHVGTAGPAVDGHASATAAATCASPAPSRSRRPRSAWTQRSRRYRRRPLPSFARLRRSARRTAREPCASRGAAVRDDLRGAPRATRATALPRHTRRPAGCRGSTRCAVSPLWR